MGKEIERKYLVVNDAFVNMATSVHTISQGYLSTDARATVRVRLIDNEARITVKSKTHGCTRGEWEYPVPSADAIEMLQLCGDSVVEKTRYVVPFEGFNWEVDVFGGKLDGLFLAEIELPAEDTPFALPTFVGEEVTGDPRYYNSNLARLSARQSCDGGQ